MARKGWEPGQLAKGVGSSAHWLTGGAQAQVEVSEAQMILLHPLAMAQKASARGCSQLGWCLVQFDHRERESTEGAVVEGLEGAVAGGSWSCS